MKNIALVGGMDRLGPHYKDEATRLGVALTIYTALETRTAERIGKADAVLIFTNKISHNLKREAVKAARSENIPVFYCHACGICTLRACLECLGCDDGGVRFPRKGYEGRPGVFEKPRTGNGAQGTADFAGRPPGGPGEGAPRARTYSKRQ